MSSRSCFTKLNFDFPYVRSISLRLDPYIYTMNYIYNKWIIDRLNYCLLFDKLVKKCVLIYK